MQEWCHSNFDKNIIYLSGQTGTGKTYLSTCMANELIKLGKLVLLTSSFKLNQDFIKSYACKDLETKNNILSKYLDVEVLFIDDLGTELRQPNITGNYLYHIINERRLNKKPTVITTNLNLEDLRDYYDERIFSRIVDKTNAICIYLEGKDLRIK
jgi:DNA replication protein DnaC